ncbi:MAG: ECF transporter S component [Lachnospiraceae bacterium]|nr:ECF transporter S component [Lachnospiraceae bacterium]
MSLAQSILGNVSFVLVCLAVTAAFIAVAVLFERAARRKNGGRERILSTRKVVVIGVFSAVSAILFCLDFPVFFAPAFYKMDFSELPALIAAFAYGPVAGLLIELVKILVKLCIKGTSTAFVGELANFVIGASFILPASVLYQFKKTRRMAVWSCVAGTAVITVVGAVFNAVYLLPAFAALYGMPMEAIIGMGSKINSGITDVTTFVILAVAPLNLLKGGLDSLITVLIYKKLSPVMKAQSALPQAAGDPHSSSAE